MRLRVGKRYRTRGGRDVTIVDKLPDGFSDPFAGSNGQYYFPNGQCRREDETILDLVEELD